MHKIHATTTYLPTYIRMAGTMLVALLFVNVIRFSNQQLNDFYSFNAVNVSIIYAMVIGFLMMITLGRKQQLDSYISIELNKIRRIYHLSKNIAAICPEAKTWFKEMNVGLRNYFKLFENMDFRRYDEGNILFRNVTYTIYQLPKYTDKYNVELYESLLDATSSATEAREYIRTTKDNSIGFFQWGSTLLITATFALLVAATTPDTNQARLIAWFVIFNIFLMIQLLYEYDRINKKKAKALAKLYLQNEASMYPDPRKELKSRKSKSAA